MVESKRQHVAHHLHALTKVSVGIWSPQQKSKTLLLALPSSFVVLCVKKGKETAKVRQKQELLSYR